MIDYIGSNTVKKYYKENGIILSDRMIAARICNAGFKFNMKEIHSSLRELQAQSEDVSLNKEIEMYISRETGLYERLKKSVPGDIYRLSVRYKCDDDYIERGYFSDFELAFSVIQEIKCNEKDLDCCKIEKFHIMDRAHIPFTEEYRDIMEDAVGYAKYDGEGELYDVWYRLKEDGVGKTSFADEYYYYPHPFKKGDILVLQGNDEVLYIMDISREEEEERKKRIASWADVTDIGISATMISRRTGRIWDLDEWVNPMEFEYAEIDANTEDVVERAALQMQRILQGKQASFQYIYDACARRQEDYLESSRIFLITGIELHPHNVFFD